MQLVIVGCQISIRLNIFDLTYVKDSKNGLRSGAGQLTKKYWHEYHKLWGGSAGTEPLRFGLESNNSLEMADNSGELIDVEAGAPKDNPEDEDSDFIASTCTNDTGSVNDGDHSRWVSSACTSISCSEDEMKVSRKRTMKPVKTLIDDKCQKLQKRLTQEGKQDIILQHSHKQLDLQQAGHSVPSHLQQSFPGYRFCNKMKDDQNKTQRRLLNEKLHYN